jgi:RimJ/RimL family protein N-acetyltransferase
MSDLYIANSDRLNFSLINARDKQLLYDLDQDPDVMLYINGGQPHSMERIEQVFIPRVSAFTRPDKGWGLWKVTLIDTDEYLGWILVRPMYFFSDTPQFNDIELGWRFFKSAWGKGYATEAASAIANALVQHDVNIKKFSAIALEENTASINIMTKLGMSFVKKDLHKDPLGDMELVYYTKVVG